MKYKRLVSADDLLFAEAAALYEISFPEHEQRLPEKQRAVMSNPRYHFDVIIDEEKFAGVLLYWELSGFAYVEHFAVHTSLRGKSLGSRVLGEFCAKRGSVILEIDPPVNEISVRREGFYLRLGFKKNVYAHTHPAYRTQYAPHELKVMSYPEVLVKKEYETFNRELGEIVMKDAPS